MKQILIIILQLSVFYNFSFGQFIASEVISPQDTIIVELDIDKGLSYSHIIKPKQTLYSIARYFHMDVNAIYAANGLTDSDIINPGQKVMIPMDIRMIDPNLANGIPVYYKVKPKETLYRIAKTYFHQEVQDIVERNKLSSFSLDVGQALHIGYLKTIESPVAIAKKDSSAIIVKNNQLIDNELLIDTSMATVDELIKKRYNEKSIAIWDRQSSDQQSSFVLHKTAKPGTYIEIYNPVVKRKTIAQVVGNLPIDLYPQDVDMVMSPLVAHNLGALDSRLMVELTYQYE